MVNAEIIDKKIIFKNFPERITTENSAGLEDEIDNILEKNVIETIEADFGEVLYISSSGLRVLLKIAKKYKDFRITNVSREVYEIFDTVGFLEMIKVEKRKRKITLDNAVLIGEGYFSKVYRIDEETIVKVYIRNTSLKDIERELYLAKQAFILGIPTAISFDVVEVEDKYGVVFEMLNCGSLRDAILREPDQFNELLEKYISLILTINSTKTTDVSLPDAKKVAFNKIETIKDKIDEGDYTRLKQLIETIPDAKTFVHGDCHVKNVMMNKDELCIIDMDTLSVGNPIFELAALYCTYKAFESIWSGNTKEFLGLEKQMCEDIQIAIMKASFGNHREDSYEENVNKVGVVAYAHMMYWLTVNAPEKEDAFKKAYDFTKEFMSKVDNLDLSK